MRIVLEFGSERCHRLAGNGAPFHTVDAMEQESQFRRGLGTLFGGDLPAPEHLHRHEADGGDNDDGRREADRVPQP